MKIDLEVGVCATCKHHWEEWDDPGARDCSLPSVQMITDVGCKVEDKFVDLSDDVIETLGQDGEHQCPFWEPPLSWCEKHKKWFFDVGDGCEMCLEELEKMYQEMDK